MQGVWNHSCSSPTSNWFQAAGTPGIRYPPGGIIAVLPSDAGGSLWMADKRPMLRFPPPASFLAAASLTAGRREPKAVVQILQTWSPPCAARWGISRETQKGGQRLSFHKPTTWASLSFPFSFDSPCPSSFGPNNLRLLRWQRFPSAVCLSPRAWLGQPQE